MKLKPIFFIPNLIAVTIILTVQSLATEVPMKFDFGAGAVTPGYTRVLPDNVYNKESGYGFEPGATINADHGGKDALRGGFCTSDKPFYFSVAVPEGNYRVTVTIGDAQDKSNTTIKAELRRLMLETAVTAKGKFTTQRFIVNVRRPEIAGGGKVSLKKRELESEMWNWDEKLTLEFNGLHPCVRALEIERADKVPTIFLLGDSTVCDQPQEPWNSWGQMLPRFFKPEVAVANHANSGESLKSSIAAHRLDKVLSVMRPGDYLFIQYGHNDMKDKSANALETYKANLKRVVASTREKGSMPVLITSMERMAGVDKDTLENYPATVCEVAKEDNVPLIDLHAKSRVFYKALGGDLKKAFQDGTHHNNYGSYELAKCVVQGIRDNKLDIAKYISDDVERFDPAHPDSVEKFDMPASPGTSGAKPLGD